MLGACIVFCSKKGVDGAGKDTVGIRAVMAEGIKVLALMLILGP